MGDQAAAQAVRALASPLGITASDVTATLLSYDTRDKKTSEEGASASASDGQGFMVRDNNGGKSKTKGKKGPQCFHVKEWGLIRRHCPTWRPDGAANIVNSALAEDSELLALESKLFDEV